MYTIDAISEIPACANGIFYRVEITVDTEADLPAPREKWAVGSFALIADTHEVRVLNHKREWV